MTLVHFDEAMLHLMQLVLVISHCNITFSVFWLSQGSAATSIRWGGWNSYCHMCRSFSKSNSENALKSIDFFTKLPTKRSWVLFHGPRCISMYCILMYLYFSYCIIMVALCNRTDHYIFALWFLSFFFFFFFFSSPNLSGRRLDVYHTSTHGVALVRI